VCACASQGFSATQLESFSLTQAAVITQAQYQSLDPAKQQVILSKLSTIQADLLNDPTVDDGGGSAGNASV